MLTGWLVGCSSTPKGSWPLGAPLPATPDGATATATARSPSPALPTVAVPDPLTIATPEPLPMITDAAATGLATNGAHAWLSLEAWGVENGVGRPLPIPGSTHPAFALRGPKGALALRVGTRLATYDGYSCWLGFAPQLINGLPHVHWLDALKNLQPLLGLVGPRPPGRRVIVLDPGHGGKDSGARSTFNGTYEKELALDWALRTGRLLAARGWQVYFTRTNDATVALPDRVALAEQVQADLFLSLHFNSGLPNPDLAGIETYCLTPAGLPSSLLRGYEDDPRQAYPNNAFDAENLQLAFVLQRTLVQATGATDRGVRRARFMSVLRGQNRPAVLIEGGYLTNPAEARRIASADYRQKLAAAVAKGLGE